MTLTRRSILGGAAAFGAGGLAVTALPLLGSGGESRDSLGVEDVLYDIDGPVQGNPEGDVTIVEYFDYQCPYCKMNHPMLLDLVARDGNLRLVMKDWPIFGAPSVQASQLALGAVELGDYEAAHNALMATEGRLSNALIEETLEAAGVDPAAAEEAYKANRDRWDRFMTRNSKQAAVFGLRGTPAFIIGTRIYAGALDGRALSTAVSQARST
ncbi:DsbA family protein [Halodurantibacterium flavum]|uniref:DsbA family protein n=1 Tax=Halodurantibacterium flavum TaxID=1382802 RepID=A0ABW4S3Z8_9RHOB